MSPALVLPPTDIIKSKTSVGEVSRDIFPDGVKTAGMYPLGQLLQCNISLTMIIIGQHPPLYDQIYPYSQFPKRIDGPTKWNPEDYSNNPERWVHRFTEAELAELSKTADAFIASKIPLTGITKENFPLPGLTSLLEETREHLLNGKGFNLFKGFPVEEWGNHKSAVAYIGIGAYLGFAVSQNGRGKLFFNIC